MGVTVTMETEAKEAQGTTLQPTISLKIRRARAKRRRKATIQETTRKKTKCSFTTSIETATALTKARHPTVIPMHMDDIIMDIKVVRVMAIAMVVIIIPIATGMAVLKTEKTKTLARSKALVRKKMKKRKRQQMKMRSQKRKRNLKIKLKKLK